MPFYFEFIVQKNRVWYNKSKEGACYETVVVFRF